ncbi:hypothetical protein PY254_10960 [Rhodanobacter sp. AS-Z3]|uniref:hypothetical protein n=1 Tax=Rhodanobacter sp. AS-Z3 TaxID=3031330 RepID=UPI0024785038|nr:hypothetical protein [Rhodanobacter sp. AS-Z3]WEN13764.1 hypothetical protein PY254_10960 [Rhodanobacter sp. AS-Z3]
MATQGTSPARAQRRRAAGNLSDNRDVRSGIWIVHAMDGGRRIPLLGDLRHEHFYFTEGDPRIDFAEYELDPTITTLDAVSDKPLRFDGVVVTLDGSRHCRRVAERSLDHANGRDAHLIERYTVAARRLGGTFEEVTAVQLDAASVRVSNWIRVMGAYVRCRGRSLGVIEVLVAAHVPGASTVTLGDLLNRLSDQPPAFVLASVAKLLRRRALCSDLDERAWSRHTLLWRA